MTTHRSQVPEEAANYFGEREARNVYITAVFKPGRGWTPTRYGNGRPRWHVSKNKVRELRRAGVEAIELTSSHGRTADFSIQELTRRATP